MISFVTVGRVPERVVMQAKEILESGRVRPKKMVCRGGKAFSMPVGRKWRLWMPVAGGEYQLMSHERYNRLA
ncbi:MAG: hypothetical protein ACRDC0_01820 [Aeromonas veronii]|uniref:ParE family toxin-like protein n=1 Tax=Aeromonas sp. Y318-3 TaxID=2990509 RepID=UPI003EE63029